MKSTDALTNQSEHGRVNAGGICSEGIQFHVISAKVEALHDVALFFL